MHQRSTTCAAGLVGLLALGAATVAVGGFAGAEGTDLASVEMIDRSGAVVGHATFTEDATGAVHVSVHLRGVPEPALHGLHIHTTGVCEPSASFLTANGHYNPGAAMHGSHAGDLPNLIVNPGGAGRLNLTIDHLTVDELLAGDGSALVVHEGTDDLVTNPTGNSGGRIACGVLTG
jgi:Cu-Zn family superoxide dismutase